MPVDPKTDISVTLMAEEWNIVLEALSDGRFKVVGPVIQKILGQAQSETERPPRPQVVS